MLFRRKIIPAVIAGTLLGANSAVPEALAESQARAHDDDTAQHMTATSSTDASSSADSKSAGGTGHGKDKNQQQSLSSTAQEAWLNGKLDTALLFTDELNAVGIDTKITNGVAHLTGTVESDVHRDLAGEIAQSIDGVDSVDNDLKVSEADTQAMGSGTAAAADERFRRAVESAALTARIKGELLLNSNTSGLSIDVDSTPATVVLSGSVDSEASKELAEQIAQNAAGNREIENALRVAPRS